MPVRELVFHSRHHGTDCSGQHSFAGGSLRGKQHTESPVNLGVCRFPLLPGRPDRCFTLRVFHRGLSWDSCWFYFLASHPSIPLSGEYENIMTGLGARILSFLNHSNRKLIRTITSHRQVTPSTKLYGFVIATLLKEGRSGCICINCSLFWPKIRSERL
jgi:hypothetical protein